VLEIRDIDIADRSQLRQWYVVWHDAQVGRPQELVTPWEVARVSLPRPHPDFDVSMFGVFDGNRQVGAGMLNLSLRENLSVAYAEVATHPEHRRRGVGTSVVEEVERRSRSVGRTRTLYSAFASPGERSPGEAFAEATGHVLANREGMKAVDLNGSEERWRPLDDQAEAASGDYRILTWRDAVPDEYVDGVCSALGVFMSLVPQGDLALEDGEWTPERVHAAEARAAEIGQVKLIAAAVTPDGRIAGLQDMTISTHDSRVGHIGITLVLPEHRGHRLGLAMKLASHRAVREAFPECRYVVTSNSETNEHMNAINVAMGYRQLETLLEYHKQL
jgi:GNAT superfamily N-acetyltransferase